MEPKKGGLKKLRARLEATKKQIERVKKDGADVAMAAALLSEVEKCLQKGEEAEATKIMDNIDLMLKQAKAKKKYDMMIFNSLPIIEKAKRAGANVAASEALLAKARELLERGDFGDAHEQIKLARREADNAKHFMTAKGHIQRIAPIVEAAKRRGVNVQEATTILLEAWQALNGGNFDLVTELVKKTSTVLNIAEEQKSYEISILDMEARINTVAESGVDIKEMAVLLKEAKKALEDERFGDVKTNVNKIRREIEKVILRREADLTLRTIRQFVRETKRAGIKSDDLEEMLQKASIALHDGNFTEVRAMELSAKQAVKNLKLFDKLTGINFGSLDKEQEEGFVTLIKEELEDSKVLAGRATASGIDASEINRLINDTEEALNGHRLDKSFELARELRRHIQDDKSGFQTMETQNKLEGLFTMLEEAKTIGIDVAEAEMLASKAKAEDAHGAGIADIVNKAEAALSGAIKTGVAGKHPRLKISINSEGFEAQKWGRANVQFSNAGNSIAKNIDMNFFGDVEVKGWQTIPKLIPGQHDSRVIALKPLKPGKVPLDMTVQYEKSFDDTKFQLNDLKDIDVDETGTYLVEDAFLIHNNGLLISRQTRRIKEDVDSDLFSAMLTAISQFAIDSFKLEDKVALSRLEFGDNQVIIERGSCFYVAATLLGSDSVYMPFYISEIVGEIEEKFGETLSGWEGDISALAGVDDIVKKILFIKNTDSGVPYFENSILQPALDAIKNGAIIPDFDKNIKELLMSFEEELISGEMGDASELMGKIREKVEEGLGSALGEGEEEKRKDKMLMESMRSEVEIVRRQIERAETAGVDISKEDALLQELLNLLEEKDYASTRGMLTDIKNLLNEKDKRMAAESHLKHLDLLKSNLTAASRMGVDVSDIEGTVAGTENELSGMQAENIEARFRDIGNRLAERTGAFMANKYPKLQVDIGEAKGHEAGKWSRMDVVVSNKGNTPARNIGLNFTGDIEVKDTDTLDIIEPGSSRRAEVSVRPTKNGKLKVDVSASYQRYFDETKYQLNDMKDLDVQTQGSYIVEDAFLIHNNGLLIARETRRIREEVDGDLFSAMLKAMTDFIREAFNIQNKGGLDRMEFGGHKLLIEKGKYVFLAITVSGEESAYIPFFMTEVIREIENIYSGELKNWNGEMDALAGIKDIVKKIIFVNRTGIDGRPMLESSILAPILEKAGGGGIDGQKFEDIEKRIAEINYAVEQNGMEAAARYLTEMEAMLVKLASLPSTGGEGGENIDADSLKKRMYDVMIRSGRIDKDSAIMDARLNNYLEVVGKIADAVFGLREEHGIPAGQKLARVAIRHRDYERWNEVLENMRTLVLEQANAFDIQLLRRDEVWAGLVPAINVNEEHIRNSYKHIAKKIISVLQYMPPDKLLANIKKGTFTIGVEGQQIYITDDMVQISFSLPPGAFEGEIDSGTIYIDTMITEQVKSDVSLNALIDKIKEMRREVEIGDEAKIEVQVVTDDALAETLEGAKNTIMEKCNAYDVIFPLDDHLSTDEYHVGEIELNGEKCRIGIVQVDFEE